MPLETLALPATETVAARMRGLDTWTPELILQALWEQQLAAVAAVGPALPAIAAAAAAAVPRLLAGGRRVYAGAGTSGRIGVQDGAELPPTFDWPAERLVLLMAGGAAAFTQAIENAEDDAASAEAAIAAHRVGPQDVVIGIAASGSTPFTTVALAAARQRGALTVAVANAVGTLLAVAEFPILVETGSEAVAGSTRLKAGTAQKVVLNLFSTLVMIRLGRVHDGLMVDMQARNAKLRARAVRMLRQLTDCDEAAAVAALGRTGGRVKPAVLAVFGSDAPDAVLDRHDGSLRAALAEIGR